MARKKSEANTCTYKGKTFTILEDNGRTIKLTDGIIHFWVKADKVERN